jgi:hypothetical protein
MSAFTRTGCLQFGDDLDRFALPAYLAGVLVAREQQGKLPAKRRFEDRRDSPQMAEFQVARRRL